MEGGKGERKNGAGEEREREKRQTSFVSVCKKYYSLSCKEGHPRKPQIVRIDKHVLNKHVWRAAMLEEREGELKRAN